MSWAAVFWIVYGVGSTLFVVYLFRMGRTVASNRKELIEREIERIRPRSASVVHQSDLVASKLAVHDAGDERSSKVASRLHVQRIFQPDENHLAVQGVRAGASCVINLPLGEAAAMSLIPNQDKRRFEVL